MDYKRLWHSFRLCTVRGGVLGRGNYIRKHALFKNVGLNFEYMPRVLPLYANLISIGDNVIIASNVSLITHDVIHVIFNRMYKKDFLENVGCIEIGNNVFIAAGVTIFSNIKIGNKVIISGGSVVNKDIEDNSVVKGFPAERVCSFDDFYNSRIQKNMYPKKLKPMLGKSVNKELENWLWNDFKNSRQKNN